MNCSVQHYMPLADMDFFDDLLDIKREFCDKEELCEDKIKEISAILKKVRAETNVSICYYDVDSYITAEGVVSYISYSYKYICVCGIKIDFENIKSIEIKNPDVH